MVSPRKMKDAVVFRPNEQWAVVPIMNVKGVVYHATGVWNKDRGRFLDADDQAYHESRCSTVLYISEEHGPGYSLEASSLADMHDDASVVVALPNGDRIALVNTFAATISKVFGADVTVYRSIKRVARVKRSKKLRKAPVPELVVGVTTVTGGLRIAGLGTARKKRPGSRQKSWRRS